jgi:hypothetical protein
MDKEKNIEKSPGWEKFASKFHDKFKEIMAPYKNNILETARIRRIVEKVPEFKDQEQWIYPSDHCKNHTNKGACWCALTKDSIFERISRGKYRVL